VSESGGSKLAARFAGQGLADTLRREKAEDRKLKKRSRRPPCSAPEVSGERDEPLGREKVEKPRLPDPGSPLCSVRDDTVDGAVLGADRSECGGAVLTGQSASVQSAASKGQPPESSGPSSRKSGGLSGIGEPEPIVCNKPAPRLPGPGSLLCSIGAGEGDRVAANQGSRPADTPESPRDMAARLYRAFAGQMDQLEARLGGLFENGGAGAPPGGLPEIDRTVKTLASLAKTLSALMDLKSTAGPDGEGEHLDDREELRAALARRLERLCQAGTD